MAAQPLRSSGGSGREIPETLPSAGGVSPGATPAARFESRGSARLRIRSRHGTDSSRFSVGRGLWAFVRPAGGAVKWLISGFPSPCRQTGDGSARRDHGL